MNCNAIVRPIELATVGLLLARLRCLFFRALAFCNVCPEPDNFRGPAVGILQETRLVLYPKVVAILGSKPVLLHQVAQGHQDRHFPASGHLVIGVQTGYPPVRGQRFLDFVTQDSLDAVTYPLAAKTFSCYCKHINDGRNGIQYMVRPFAGFDLEPNQYQPEATAERKDGEPNNSRSPRQGSFVCKEQETGADDQGCDHQTNCSAIVRPIQLATVGLLLARLRSLFFRVLAFCNVGPEPDNFRGPAVGFPQEARLVLHPKVVAVLASKPVLLHQAALGHQDRRFLDSGHLVIGMQTGDPPVGGQRFLDFVTQDSLDAVTYPLAAKTFSCFLKHINDGRNGIQYIARPYRR